MVARMKLCASLRALSFVSILATTACGTTFPMTPDASVPFAQGEVDGSFEDNGNGSFTIKINHLGEPAKISGGATVYVVWVKPKKEGSAPQNMGAIKPDADQQGELLFSTTFREFEVFVTPETAADALKPEGRVLLRAEISG